MFNTPATEISGVNGTAAPVNIRFLNTAGSIASALLPTGNVTDVVTADGTDYTVTLIDNGQPLVIIDANDLGVTGYETVPELTDNTDLKTRIEALRLAAAQVMGLGDVTDESYPKMTLVAAPRDGGAISTRISSPIEFTNQSGAGRRYRCNRCTPTGLGCRAARHTRHRKPAKPRY